MLITSSCWENFHNLWIKIKETQTLLHLLKIEFLIKLLNMKKLKKLQSSLKSIMEWESKTQLAVMKHQIHLYIWNQPLITRNMVSLYRQAKSNRTAIRHGIIDHRYSLCQSILQTVSFWNKEVILNSKFSIELLVQAIISTLKKATTWLVSLLFHLKDWLMVLERLD